jgi:hypothetical protein
MLSYERKRDLGHEENEEAEGSPEVKRIYDEAPTVVE